MKGFLYVAIVLVSHLSNADAQTIYKCVSKDGKTNYSNSPCPDAKKLNETPAFDIERATQAQADVAADCSEALFNQSDPGWKDKERERAAFDKYCPAFGFMVPLGPGTKAFNDKLAVQLIAKLREKYAVPSSTRTYSGGYRSPPSFLDAERAMQERPVARAVIANAIALPGVQRGLWKFKSAGSGAGTQSDLCGDPLERIRHEIMKISDLATLGCSIRTTSPAPRSVTYVVDCAADRSEAGRSVKKGRAELSIVSRTPQSIAISAKRADGGAETYEATRVGDCQ